MKVFPYSSEYCSLEVVEHESGRAFYISILEEIEMPSEYTKILRALREATGDDVVILTIESSGGRVDSGMILYEAVKDCEAPVIGQVIYQACSMGFAILMACDNIQVTEYAEIMIHNASEGGGTSTMKIHEAKAYQDFSKERFDKLLDIVYSPILTTKELKQVKEGKDLYLMGSEFSER